VFESPRAHHTAKVNRLLPAKQRKYSPFLQPAGVGSNAVRRPADDYYAEPLLVWISTGRAARRRSR
jgi:hypothetical protein